MIEAPLFAATGKKAGSLSLPAEYFDGTVNEPVMHQAVKVFLANQRQGTHKTKTRRWVTGGNQKPWKQKGTGRARQGSNRAPHWPGGGTVFGPQPRDYSQGLPKKQRLLAVRSAFNARAREGALFVVESLEFAKPATKQLVGLLDTLGLGGRKALLLTDGSRRNTYLSGRNVPSVEVKPYSDVTTYDVLWSDTVVVERGALADGSTVTAAEGTESGGESPTRSRTVKKASKAAEKASAKAAKKASAKAAKKASAKAPAKAKVAKTAKAAKKATGGKAKSAKKKGSK